MAKRKRKKRKLTGKSLTSRLDRTVREIMRLRTFNPVCFVCGKNYGWWDKRTNPRGCQTGHFIGRDYFAVRWDLMNVWEQCSVCNVKHNQNAVPFTLRIIEVHGLQRIDYLDKKCNAYTSFTTLEKREILIKLEVIKHKLLVDRQIVER